MQYNYIWKTISESNIYKSSAKVTCMIIPVKLAYIIISTKRICIIIVSKQTCTYMYLLLYNCYRSVMDSRVFPRELPLGVSNFCLYVNVSPQ